MEKFTVWLLNELRGRDLTPADLAKKAAIDPGNLSRVLNGQRRIGPDACVNIARALGEPPEKLFRLAGLLPELPPDDRAMLELIEFARRLSPEDRAEVLRYAKYRAQVQPVAPLAEPDPEKEIYQLVQRLGAAMGSLSSEERARVTTGVVSFVQGADKVARRLLAEEQPPDKT